MGQCTDNLKKITDLLRALQDEQCPFCVEHEQVVAERDEQRALRVRFENDSIKYCDLYHNANAERDDLRAKVKSTMDAHYRAHATVRNRDAEIIMLKFDKKCLIAENIELRAKVEEAGKFGDRGLLLLVDRLTTERDGLRARVERQRKVIDSWVAAKI